MENASKALIMAGGVLIGVLVLSLGVYLFTTFGGQASSMYDEIQQQQIEQFNSQFNVYLDSNKITIYDIASMAEIASEFNKTTDNAQIQILLNNTTDLASESWRASNSYEDLFKIDRDKIENIRSRRVDKIEHPTTTTMKENYENIVSSIGYLPRYECVDKSYDENTGRIRKASFRLVGTGADIGV